MEGMSARPRASTRGHSFSADPFGLQHYRGRGDLRLPAVPSPDLDGKEGSNQGVAGPGVAHKWRAPLDLQGLTLESRLPEPALIGAIKGSAPRSGATSLRSLRLLRTSIDHVEPTAAQIRCAYRRSLDCSQALARPRSESAPDAVGGEHDLAHASAPPICRRVTQPMFVARARKPDRPYGCVRCRSVPDQSRD
jgi:hypothetical protein